MKGEFRPPGPRAICRNLSRLAAKSSESNLHLVYKQRFSVGESLQIQSPMGVDARWMIGGYRSCGERAKVVYSARLAATMTGDLLQTPLNR
jgi:hypothetical protein